MSKTRIPASHQINMYNGMAKTTIGNACGTGLYFVRMFISKETWAIASSRATLYRKAVADEIQSNKQTIL
jgi:hypothetical protein